MISNKSLIDFLSSRLQGPSFWAPALGKRGGVAILCSEAFRGSVSSWQKDSSGRVLSLLLKTNEVKVNLVNIYAPTVPVERNVFLKSLHKYFFPGASLILGGDFNCYDGVRDKYGGNVVLSKELSRFKSNFSLIDAWRSKHIASSQFTWWSPSFTVASRLDTFLISNIFREQIVGCEIVRVAFRIMTLFSLTLMWLLIFNMARVFGNLTPPC